MPAAMRLLIVGDPLAGLRPASDTSLAMLCEARRRGFDVWWAEDADVVLCGLETRVRAARVTAATARALPQCAEPSWHGIPDFDAVLIRKDPPFDESYLKLCWLLLPCEERVVMQNRPSALLRHHEKLIPYQALASGALQPEDVVPMCLATSREVVEHFLAAHPGEEWVIKPWTGFGGRNVRRVTGRAAVLDAVTGVTAPQLIQPFLPEVITAGDRRVFVIGGQIAAHFVRLPQAGNFISNLAYGGRAEVRSMDAQTLAVCERMAGYLARCDIDFAGLDVIGHRVTEVNITSPTGVIAWQDVGGDDVSRLLIDLLETRALPRKE